MSKWKKIIVGLESLLLSMVIFYLCFLSLPLQKPLYYLGLVASLVFSGSLGHYFYSSRMAIAEAVEVVDGYLFGKKVSLLARKHFTNRIAKDLYKGSIDNLVFALDGNEKISEEDAKEVLEYLEKL